MKTLFKASGRNLIFADRSAIFEVNLPRPQNELAANKKLCKITGRMPEL
jgi:hypothetical protein